MRGLIKKQIGLFIVIIILMILTIISSSYALFKTENRLTTINHQTKTFNVTYSSGSPTLSGNIYAMTYQEAMEQHDYQITISSNGTTNYGTIYYFEFFNNPPDNFNGELVNPQYIWIAVDSYAQRMSDLSTVEEDGVTYYTFGSNILNPNSSITHNIDVWLDNDIPSSEVDKYVYLEVRVTSEATSEFDYRTRQTICSVIGNTYGNPGEIGSKYECDLGDGISRIFYLLKNDELTNTVRLIYEKNVSDLIGNATTMSYADANAFFDQGNDGYAVKQAWSKVVSVNLPTAQDIIDASIAINPKNGWSLDLETDDDWFCFGSHVKDYPTYNGESYCENSAAQQKAAWLFDYTKECTYSGCTYEYPDEQGAPSGYWTSDLLNVYPDEAWLVDDNGRLAVRDKTTSNKYGVRPVITIYKTNLNNTLQIKACNYLNSNFGDASNHLSVGTEYVCDLGDGVNRNFYILVNDSSNNQIKMIMDRNLSDTVGSNKTTSWNDAITFFEDGHPGYDTKQAWTNIISADLPGAQDIANAVNNNTWIAANSYYTDWFCLALKDQSSCMSQPTEEFKATNANYAWLFNNLLDSVNFGGTAGGSGNSRGYWTKDAVAQSSDENDRAWFIFGSGALAFDLQVPQYSDYGVRPVVTISTSKINQN